MNLSTVNSTQSRLAVLLVTHNSGAFLKQNLAFLNHQARSPDLVLIVDCCSTDAAYIREMTLQSWAFTLEVKLLTENLGYAEGNNLGLKYLMQAGFDDVLVLNPDAFLVDCQSMASMLEARSFLPATSVVAPVLLRYDLANSTLTNQIDSAGIACTGIGRWVDRLSGSVYQRSPENQLAVHALCGAAVLLPAKVINLLVESRGFVFDSSFFMYKEDIELGCYLQVCGIPQIVLLNITIGHCRGWKKRSDVPRWSRLLSAKNDVKVAWRYRRRALPFAILKLFLVRVCDI